MNTALVVDCSKYLDCVLHLDVAGRRCVVGPGIVLDELNRRLKPHAVERTFMLEVHQSL